MLKQRECSPKSTYHQSLIDEERLKEKSSQCSTLSKYKKHAIDPGKSKRMEYGKEKDLWKIGPEKQGEEDKQREEEGRKQSSSQERV